MALATMTEYNVGDLVEIQGMKVAADVPVEWRSRQAAAPQDVNGQKGQLVQFDDHAGQWTVALFSASMVSVKQEFLRHLTADDLQGTDLVLGPASNMDVMGSELAECLASKGYAVAKFFVSDEDLKEMTETAERCERDGAFQRLPVELEPGYLGTQCVGKTLAIDLDAPGTADFIRDSSLRIAEEGISAVGTLLRPFAEAELGFDIYSRSTTMMALPLELHEEEEYEAPELENGDAAAFLTMLWRAKLMVIMNAGPGTANLVLTPKASGDSEMRMDVEPGSVAIFCLGRYKFSYHHEGDSLSLSTFYLDVPKEYTIDNIYGDINSIVGNLKGCECPDRTKKEHIPVVAMSMRYAFGADEPWKTWVGYSKAGFDTVSKFPISRWDPDSYYMEDADVSSGKSYTCHGGFSDGIELFDCKFFDISPAEARSMDPTQRQVLEVAYMSLLGGGWDKKNLSSKSANIASFVGLDKNEWGMVPKPDAGSFGSSGGANSITSNRFNYCLNLKGASLTVDTACSSSLVAVHTAKLYLLFKHYDACEAVIICGVNLSLSPLTYIGCCAAGMHSHKGRCFTYNSSADGYTRGESTAANCLKLKGYDKEEGHYGILAGSQVNQDGRSASLTAPNGPAQEKCSKAVIAELGIKTAEIDTTECHGTGTSLGDPIEIGAYRKVMGASTRTSPVVVTSSKSNIGHCEGNAGLSGLIKCTLMSAYGEAAGNVHLRALNPHLDMNGFPAVILSEGMMFRAEASYNGVLSFGFGGTNACGTMWGTNVMTSRSMASKDLYSLVLRKIQSAPPQNVMITGDDWEEWEMEFPTKDAKNSDRWDVEIDDDGVLTYTKQDPLSKELGSEYHLTGTFNDWELEPMQADDDVPGLYYATVEIGPDCQENFQIMADEKPEMTLFPEQPQCESRAAMVRGPASVDKDSSWLIKGQDGDRFRVELHISEQKKVSVSWLREQ